MTLPSDRTVQLTGALMAVVAAIAFSGKAIFIKLAYRHGVDAITLLALRMLFAAPLFLALALWASSREGVKALSRKQWLAILGIGLLGNYASSYFDFLGLQYITAALERVLLFLYPTFVALYVALVEGQRLSRQALFALAASYGGIVLVFLNDLATQQTDVVLGTFWVLVSALTYAAYLICTGRMVRHVGSLRFSSLAALAACLGIASHYLAVNDAVALAAQPLAVYGWALTLAVASTVLPIVLVTESIRRLGASRVATIGTLGPVATILLGDAFLDEPVTALQLTGAALVTAGVLAVSLKREPAAPVLPPSSPPVAAPLPPRP